MLTPLHKGLPKVQLIDSGKMTTMTMCLDSGKVATDACLADVRTDVKRTSDAKVYPEDKPKEKCDKHVLVDWCTEGNGVANDYCHLFADAYSLEEGYDATKPLIKQQSLVKMTKEEVEARLSAGETAVVRQKIPQEGTTTFSDAIFGDITVPNAELDENVLIKTDGLPTYNFANVIDDHLMGITHVVRGSEYLSSAPKYNLLYQAFGWDVPAYVHCSPVMRDATTRCPSATVTPPMRI